MFRLQILMMTRCVWLITTHMTSVLCFIAQVVAVMKDDDYIINDHIWESSVLSLSTSSSTMLSSSVRPVARCRALHAPLLRRNASGTPHYNEPSGWLFGEKVRLNVSLNTFWVSSTSISPHHLDKSVKRRAGKLFGIGECLEGWACQRSCYIINRTRGTFGYLQ